MSDFAFAWNLSNTIEVHVDTVQNVLINESWILGKFTVLTIVTERVNSLRGP
jgi:hypothetical protein